MGVTRDVSLQIIQCYRQHGETNKHDPGRLGPGRHDTCYILMYLLDTVVPGQNCIQFKDGQVFPQGMSVPIPHSSCPSGTQQDKTKYTYFISRV